MRFENRVAIITGGSEGMGKAAALIFAREGAKVAITSRSEEKLKKAVDEIKAAGGTAMSVQGDVTSNASIKNVVAKVLEQYGKIDILFNYVGGEPGLSAMKPFIEHDEEYYDEMITLNLKSTIMFCRAVLDTMMAQKYGKIVNTAAIAGRQGSPRMALYSAVKGGIIAFTKSLAVEMAPYNINVNAVSPGPIDTPGFNKLFGEEGKKRTSNFVPLGRLGRPEDVANGAVFLASEEASFITGQTLAVDGGVTMV